MPDDPQRRDWARSYLRRQGRTTRAQKRAIRELWPEFGLTWSHDAPLNLPEAFGRDAHTVLEIGFGTGDALLHLAALHPEWNVLGVETHRPGVGAALKALGEQGLTNARIVRGDAIELLAYHLDDRAVDEVCVFFPDPWPRAKDVGRRIVRPWLAELLSRRVRPGGSLHLATDVADYAAHMVEVMDASPAWRNRHPDTVWAPRPSWRPITRYERRAHEEGRRVRDLSYALDGARHAEG